MNLIEYVKDLIEKKGYEPERVSKSGKVFTLNSKDSLDFNDYSYHICFREDPANVKYAKFIRLSPGFDVNLKTYRFWVDKEYTITDLKKIEDLRAYLISISTY